jgi:predicted nucleic acid-binding protein
MKKLLLDINVVPDILLDRKPHAVVSGAVRARIEEGEAKGFLPAHGATTIFYLIKRDKGAKVARQALEAIVRILEVAPVDDPAVSAALTLDWPDFEDAVCAAGAKACGCDAIVSRDPAGFPDPPVPVLDPETAPAWLISD